MNLKSNLTNYNLIILSICFVFVLSLSFYAYTNSVNMFWADEWDTPGNILNKEIKGIEEITFGDFYCQHNESRKLIPKLLYYSAYKIGYFDTRIGVFLRIAMSIFSIILIYNICKSDDKNSNSIKLLVIVSLIYIPTQSYNQIFGLQFITIVPSFCLVLIILAYKNIQSTKYCAVLSVILCIISTYTYSNGLIIWVIGNPLVFKLIRAKEFKLSEILFFNILFLCTTVLYFHEYQHPSHHPGMIKGILHPLRTIKYFTLWLWSPFVIHLPHTKYLAYTLTIAYLIVFYFLVTHTITSFRSSKNITFSVLCPILLSIYGLISGSIASLGRSGFGVEAALGPQYPSFALWAHLGMCILIVTGLPFSNKLFRISILTGYALLYIVCFESGIKDFKKWSYKMNQCKLTVENLDICPNNPLISDFHPAPATILSKAISFNQNNLLQFSGRDWLLNTKPKDDPTCGFVTTTTNTRTVNLFGWAIIPKTKKPADFVLVATIKNERLTPLTLLFLDVRRVDVKKALNSDYTDLFGFNKTFSLESLKGELACYAVDEKNKVLLKLTEF